MLLPHPLIWNSSMENKHNRNRARESYIPTASEMGKGITGELPHKTFYPTFQNLTHGDQIAMCDSLQRPHVQRMYCRAKAIL